MGAGMVERRNVPATKNTLNGRRNFNEAIIHIQ
jgi:hypothetical protein